MILRNGKIGTTTITNGVKLMMARVGEIAGIPPSDLSHIEIGKKAASSYDLFALAEFFNVSVDYFYKGIENRKFITDERTEKIMGIRNLSESFSDERLGHLYGLVQDMDGALVFKNMSERFSEKQLERLLLFAESMME